MRFERMRNLKERLTWKITLGREAADASTAAASTLVATATLRGSVIASQKRKWKVVAWQRTVI